MNCRRCGKTLTYNEIGANRKFICREAEEFFCRECLADALHVSPESIDRKIEQFRRQGCMLFI